MDEYKWNDIEHDEGEEMENEEYVKEIKVKRRSLCQVIGGLLIFVSGVVAGHFGTASHPVIVVNNNRELNAAYAVKAAVFALKHKGLAVNAAKEAFKHGKGLIGKFGGLISKHHGAIKALATRPDVQKAASKAFNEQMKMVKVKQQQQAAAKKEKEETKVPAEEGANDKQI